MNKDSNCSHEEGSVCDECSYGKIHQQKAKISRAEYQKDVENSKKDKSGDTSYFAVDMQKVFLIPKMRLKEHFFISRMTVFNETFASLNGSDDICILWN